MSRPRQPCVGLALAAAAGIVTADFLPVNSPAPWLIPLFLFGAAALFFSAMLWPFVVLAFFILHQFTFHHAPGRRMAMDLSAQRQPITAIGTVIDEPDVDASRSAVSSRFPMRLEQISLRGLARPTRAKVMAVVHGTPPAYGDRIMLRGAARHVPPPRNPAQFDATAFLARRGIFSELRVQYPADMRVVGSNRGNSIIAAAIKTRQWLKHQIQEGSGGSAEINGLLHGMLLGLKNEAPPQVEKMFRHTGTLHLFAVSGLHVGMFALIVWAVVKPIGLRRSRAILIVILALAFYATVTGLRPSGVRAAIMASAILGGYLIDRRALPANGLAAAALILLLWDTNQLFSAGFQMSFGVVAAILLCAAGLRTIILRAGAPDPFLPRVLFTPWQNMRHAGFTALAALLSMSLAAWIGSLPLTYYYFNLIAPITVVANLFLVPMAFVVLAIGTIGFVCATFSSWLAGVFSNANWLAAHAVLGTAQLLAEVPAGHFHVARLSAPDGALCEITVLDLGAGAAIHIRDGGNDWIIDTGSERVRHWLVEPYLRSRGIDCLDGMIITHGDGAHIGGAAEIIAEFNPRTIADSALRDRSATRNRLHAALAERGIGKAIYVSGESIRISPRTLLRVLYPRAGIHPRTADDKAFVLKLESAGTRVLFTSDSGFFTERWLLDHSADVRSDILVKNHQQSDFSAIADFLAAVKPSVLVAAAATLPESARISEEWAREVTAGGIHLFRQDKTGAVTILLKEDGFEVRPFLGDQIFRSRSR